MRRLNLGRKDLSVQEGKGGHARIEFDLPEETYRKLCDESRNADCAAELAERVQQILERAMENYWVMAYRRMRDDYERLKEDCERYRRDNEALDAIERQNAELQALLESKGLSADAGQAVQNPSPSQGRDGRPGSLAPGRPEGKPAGAQTGGGGSRKVRVALELPSGFIGRLSQFLSEKCLLPEDALPVMVEYGLEAEDEEALKRLKEERDRELCRIDSEYAALRFRSYQYFMVNQAITMKLNILLSENRRLKEACRANSLLPKERRDEWDGWGSERVGELFRRYVFTNRG